MSRQAIKYEGTTVDPAKSAAEIAGLVQKYGGTRFEMKWDQYSRLQGVRFAIRHERLGEIPVRLMAQIANVEKYLLKKRPWSYSMRKTKAQHEAEMRDTAYRVSWRQLKDFVEQSLLAVETGLFPLHEAFMAQVEMEDPAGGDPITVGQLFEAQATRGRGGALLMLAAPAPTVEADYEFEEPTP
jgi:hypothetical protein